MFEETEKMGKLRNRELKKLLACIQKDPRVIVPPAVGYDAGVHLMGDKYLVVSADPCIGVPEEWFGWLLVNYAASDVALTGARPEFCTVNLLAPLTMKPSGFQTIMKQICGAADELNMAIVRGHTGTYDGLSKTLGVCTAYGTVAKEKLLTSGSAQAGDLILCTKALGLETLINFSLTHKALAKVLFGPREAEQLAKLVRMESCVSEALALAETGQVHALHDATEGGLTNAVNEVAGASVLGFRINFEELPITAEMNALQKEFSLSLEQVLSSSSTGMIVAAVEKNAQAIVEETLQKEGVPVSFIGSFTKSKDRILEWQDGCMHFPRVANDPYSKILSEKV
jgi:hydrogenase expression/formation protein HypE